MNKKLDAAIGYAERGWKIFPLKENSKIPASKKGHLDATTGLDMINNWWCKNPNYNIGAAMAASGLVCVDVDSYKLNCEFDEFLGDRKIPNTLTQKSARGGTHYIFQAPQGVKYPQQLCEGVDIKHTGYIVASPSLVDGSPYEWLNENEPALAPTWLTPIIRKSPCRDPARQPLDRQAASQAALNGENWHNHMLWQVGSWVAKGNTDQEIQVLAAAQTLPDYTIEQTYTEVQKMIDGARLKGFDKQPNSSAPKSVPPPRQILTMIGDIEIKDPDYLIDGTIETPALIGLIGPSGSGKTFVALDMAMSIATGTLYHSMEVKAGLVIMSAGEGHTGIPRRVQAWCTHHGQNIANANLALTSRAVNLFDEGYLSAFCKEVDTIAQTKGAPRLIVIDTVARHMGGLDENSAKDMGELIRTADKLKEDYHCAVMLVHHTGHANQDRARGSTAFKGALDTEIIVNPIGDHDLTTRCEKQKDGTPFEMRQFIKVSMEPSIVLQQVEATKKAGTRLTGNERLAFDTFKEATKGNVAFGSDFMQHWREYFYERHTCDNEKSKSTAFRRAKKGLVNKGFLSVKDGIYHLGDKAT